MATNHPKLTETIAQIAVMPMASAENNQRAQDVAPKIGGPLMTQPTFNWSTTDKYVELRKL